MLRINQKKLGAITIFEIAGRIDSINVPALRAALAGILVDEGEQHDIILNMREVNYLSAAALRVLRNLQEQTGRVCIAEPATRVREVLQITGLDAKYQLYERQLDAIQAVRPITNAHTHLNLGWLAEGLPRITGQDFVPWLRRAIFDRFQVTTDWDKQARTAAEAGVQAMVEAGVTTVGDISPAGNSLPALINARMNGVVYIELLGNDPNKVDQYMQRVQHIIDKWRPQLTTGLHLGLSLHAPYTVCPELWKRGLEYAKAEALPLCIHIAESAAETQYLHDMTGPFYTTYRDMIAQIAPLGLSPVKYLEAMGALEQAPLLVHGVQVSDDDIDLIKQYNCTIVHCPRSNLRLRCGRMPLEKYLEQGVAVMLGTDSLVSSPSLNIFDEAEFALALHHGQVAAEDILELVHQPLPGLPA